MKLTAQIIAAVFASAAGAASSKVIEIKSGGISVQQSGGANNVKAKDPNVITIDARTNKNPGSGGSLNTKDVVCSFAVSCHVADDLDRECKDYTVATREDCDASFVYSFHVTNVAPQKVQVGKFIGRINDEAHNLMGKLLTTELSPQESTSATVNFTTNVCENGGGRASGEAGCRLLPHN